MINYFSSKSLQPSIHNGKGNWVNLTCSAVNKRHLLPVASREFTAGIELGWRKLAQILKLCMSLIFINGKFFLKAQNYFRCNLSCVLWSGFLSPSWLVGVKKNTMVGNSLFRSSLFRYPCSLQQEQQERQERMTSLSKEWQEWFAFYERVIFSFNE